MSSIAAPFTHAYIIDRRTDWIWFLTLPFVAVFAGLLSDEYLPGAALAAIAVWVTVPHHFATWLRVYGSSVEFNRWRDRFIVGPVVLVLLAYVAMRYAPLSLVLIVTLWDHQHSLMQQYGFSRIYDFKAKAGTAITGKFDLLFNWIFFVNMLVVSPLWSVIWVRMLHEWRIPIAAETVHLVHWISWTIAIGLSRRIRRPRDLVCPPGLYSEPAQVSVLALQLLSVVLHELQHDVPTRFCRRSSNHARHAVHRHGLFLSEEQARAHGR